jgi:hypothetical protein
VSIVEHARTVTLHVHARIAADATVLAHLVDPSHARAVAHANDSMLIETYSHESNPNTFCVEVRRSGVGKFSCAQLLSPTLDD